MTDEKLADDTGGGERSVLLIDLVEKLPDIYIRHGFSLNTYNMCFSLVWLDKLNQSVNGYKIKEIYISKLLCN